MITDIHTHILPYTDDGADTIDESIRLLKAELDSGVDLVVLTPHFRIEKESIESFLSRRAHAYGLLSNAVKDENLKITLKLGAEVAFSAVLPEHDLTPLCFEGTKTILIELPTEHYPPFTRKVLTEIIRKGYVPIIAHAERYPYFARNPGLLEELVMSGAMAQATADCVLRPGRKRRMLFKWIKNGFIHVLATDTHGIKRRPPALDKAVELVKKKLGKDLSAR